MKHVMLLGDSIRLNYQEKVTEYLGEEYMVHAPEENCRFAKYTLNSLRFWLQMCPRPDYIHWNNGLWDTAILYSGEECFTTLSDYLRDMASILTELKKTGAEIIFATTTPVHPSKELTSDSVIPKHKNNDIILYNKHITEFMHKKNIVVNDLFNLLFPKINEYICDDLIHLTEQGKEKCGKAVAEAIRNYK